MLLDVISSLIHKQESVRKCSNYELTGQDGY